MATLPLVQLAGIGVTFGGRPLFEGIDLALARGDRGCLVGRNGSGKSTLMRVIAGEAEADAGTRYVEPGTRIAYLAQAPNLRGYAHAIDYVAAGLPHDMADEAHRAERALDLMGIAAERDPSTLSGGEARRVDLARALASEPDVLLLDEPTNHLDVTTIERLEAVLATWRGALMIISHDRAFLKALSNRSLWLDRGRLKPCPFGFDRFEQWADEDIAREEAERHKLERRIEAETDWARRGIPARRKRNQGRLRALEAMRAERQSQRLRQGVAKLEIAEAERGATVVIEAANAAVSLGGREILRDVSLKIRRGDRIGVVGPNGAGKTTLLRLLIGDLAPDRGTVRRADGIELAYFDQGRESLDPEATLKSVLLPDGGDTVRVGDRSKHVSGYLADFLFEPAQMLAQVKSLSGGERNRLLLARLFARPSNLLVLDEPTNDLDIETLDLLQEVLADYGGTVISVSHDRDFLDRIATSIVAVEGDGKAIEYVGGWSDYRRQRPADVEPRQAYAAPPAAVEKPASVPRRRKLSYKEARELAELPARIDALGSEIASLHALLADPDMFARDPSRFDAAGRRLIDAEREKARAEDRWLDLAAAEEELARP